MPAMSPTMTEGKISRWAKKEGDKFTAGEVILEIETDKATIEVEAPDDGILAKIMATPASGAVAVGNPIAFFVGEDEDWKNVKIPASSPSAAAAAPSKPAPPQPAAPAEPSRPAVATPSIAKKPSGPVAPLSPAVSHMVEQYHLNVADIPASGPKNRILKGDVLKYMQENPGASQKPKEAKAEQQQPTPAAKKPVAQINASVILSPLTISRLHHLF